MKIGDNKDDKEDAVQLSKLVRKATEVGFHLWGGVLNVTEAAQNAGGFRNEGHRSVVQ